jgi:predicted HAD superfamily Cof-like phosphohydrolase
MSKDWQKDIEELMVAFNQPVRYTPTVKVGEKEKELRYALVKEECNELLEAIQTNNMDKIADGIADLIVVTLGTAHTYGINVQPIWDEVHRTNMLKTTGPDHPVTGKKQKPAGWKPPDIKSLLIEQDWDDSEEV